MTVSGQDEQGAMPVPARVLPAPVSLSREAQSVLALGPLARASSPPHDDVAAWRAFIAAGDATILEMLEPMAAAVAAEVEALSLDGTTAYAVEPRGIAPDDRRVYFEVHGGALLMGGGACCRASAVVTAGRVGARVWSVDYRMAPDHPYPAGLDDCLRGYRAVLDRHDPSDVVVAGASAGGNLAAALVLRARDEGLPLPAGLVLITPELDLTESGDSFQANLGVDTVLTESLMPENLLYAGGHDLADPYLSPLFGDVAAGFPPTFLSAGTRDLFLSNAVRMHAKLRAAGIPSELYVMEAAPHGGFFGAAPEDAALDDEVRRFATRCWAQR